jgi:uncharacterized membrane protein
MRITFLPVGGYLVVAVIAALLLAAFVFAPLRASVLPRRRQVLVALRLAVVLLVILAMLRPTVVYTATRKQSSTLVMLVDASRSMQVADSFGNQTRWQTLAMILNESRSALSGLSSDVEIKAYAFDANTQPLGFDGATIELPPRPEGAQSAIGAALIDVLKREAGKRLAGVVLLSDGAQRAYAPHDVPPQIPARQLADLGFPLHTVVFGQARGLTAGRDVALAELHIPDTVFVKNELNVDASARVSGFVNDNIPVDLLFETAPGRMTEVGRRSIKATEDGQQVPVSISYIPQTPGEYKVTLRAKAPPGDSSPTNNELSSFVTVRKGGVNVLYLEGAHPIEAKFIRRALAAFPDLNVEYLWMDAEAPDSRPADLASKLAPGKYDVYILGDLDSSAFRQQELAQLADTVRAGAGLIMLGGLHSFGPGGYQKTPLADVLPVKMSDLERQAFDQPIATDLHLQGEIKVTPTPDGEQTRMLLLAAREANASVWSQLPALQGANRFRGLSPLANVLAVTKDGAPLLVAQTPGNGRTLAFAGDSTWRWAMHGYDDLHKRFWRQLVLWLAKKDQQDAGSIWVQLPQRRFQPGSRIELRAGAIDKNGEALTRLPLKAEVSLPDGTKHAPRLTVQGDQYVGTFYETDQAGDYTISVSAPGRDDLAQANARFLVFEQDLELENPAADPSLMQSLATLTGGEAMAPEQLVSFLGRFNDHRPDPIVEFQTKQTPWDTWPYFLTIVGLLCTEWLLRKRWGLV